MMDRVHPKSVLPETTPLLLAAHGAGTDLLWDRYERQVPLCGFTSNGLSCRKCFAGPCRINPFGDEPTQGICGADRDQIVMETIFQATLEGVLETARTVHGLGAGERELPDVAATLPGAIAARLAGQGLLPVRRADLFSVQNSYFTHKAYLADTLCGLTRLGLIHYGWLTLGGEATRRAPVHESAGTPEDIVVLVAGRAPVALAAALERLAARGADGKSIVVLAAGESAGLPLPAAVDHGSAELALGMDVAALVIAPGADWPALAALAARRGIPVITAGPGTAPEQIAAETIGRARRHAGQPAARRLAPAADARRLLQAQEPGLPGALAAGRIAGVAVILGEPNVKQAFFERTLALMEACVAQKTLVWLGGALGAHADLLAAEVARRKGEPLGAFATDLKGDGLAPIAAFGSALDIPAVVSLLTRAGLHGATPPRAVVAFPEIVRSATWASAVSFLALGFPVQIGARLPFWGSPFLAGAIPAEWQRISGGRLLAGPVLPDAAAQAGELASSFRPGAARTGR